MSYYIWHMHTQRWVHYLWTITFTMYAFKGSCRFLCHRKEVFDFFVSPEFDWERKIIFRKNIFMEDLKARVASQSVFWWQVNKLEQYNFSHIWLERVNFKFKSHLHMTLSPYFFPEYYNNYASILSKLVAAIWILTIRSLTNNV